MPAGFGRAGARFVRSVQDDVRDREKEKRYRNLCITFAVNIIPFPAKVNSQSRFSFIPVICLFSLCFMQVRPVCPRAKKTGNRSVIC